MSAELALNPLRICAGTSSSDSCALRISAEDIVGELVRRGIQDATVILWQVDQIRCGTWRNGAFHFADERPLDAALLVELRVFDAACELRLRREDSEILGRFRQDGTGEPVEYVDSMARLMGEREDQGAWMTLRDRERKLKLTMPALMEPCRYVRLVTRSYIGIHEKTAQAGYIDDRFLAIVPADMKGEE